jgi:hypothetical protein
VASSAGHLPIIDRASCPIITGASRPRLDSLRTVMSVGACQTRPRRRWYTSVLLVPTSMPKALT